MRICECGAEGADDARVCAACGADLDLSTNTSRVYEVIERGGGAALAKDLSVEAVQPEQSQEHEVGAVLGSYRLIRQIGAGGMGRVFVAEHTRLGRRVALKILRSEYSGNKEAVRRFFAEARAVNRISHENIIEISDFIENANGSSFYIMELLTGLDLHALEERERPLPLARALRIAIQVCGGLGAAHDAGIVHRDLKPDNIFLIQRGGETDFVKLLDFGVAKLLNAKLDDASSFMSMAGVVVGTPAYMAPEQGLGQPVDHRADIYSVGVILFEMITGQQPFKAESVRELMVKHMTATPPRPSRFATHNQAIPPALEELTLLCLKKEPRDRPQTIKEVEGRLREILESLSDADGGWFRFRFGLRDPRVWIATGVGLAALGGLAILGHRSSESAARPVAVPRATPAAIQAPGPPPPSPVRKSVQVTFESTPPGATVFRVGSAEALGVTPFARQFVASPDVVIFEFRKEGWKAERRELALLADTRLDLSLAPGRRAVIPGGKPPARSRPPGHPDGQANPVKLDHDVVLNPFE